MRFRDLFFILPWLFAANVSLAHDPNCNPVDTVAKVLPLDGNQIAERAGLHYLDSYPTGITRSGEPRHWSYADPDGKSITDPAELARIQKINIPDVYQKVWISTDPLSHIQATAIDAKGRTQYRYHGLWKTAKSKIKFARMIDFDDALPRVHAQEATDMENSGLPKAKVLATLATIMEKTGIRVGSEEYARDNGTYGLTTFLKDKNHAAIHGDAVTFHFIGKAGVEHDVPFKNKKVAEVMEELLRAPGNSLFQYQDESGAFHSVTASMLNEYLGSVGGGHFTAKDFRTWIGTTTVSKILMEKAVPQNAKQIKKDILEAITAASDRLGNTPSVAKSNYIEPKILHAYENPSHFAEAKKAILDSSDSHHTPEERLMRYLLQH